MTGAIGPSVYRLERVSEPNGSRAKHQRHFQGERKWKPLSLIHADFGESLRELEYGSFILSLHGWIVAKRAHKKVRKDE
jgi:hypothetical protein